MLGWFHIAARLANDLGRFNASNQHLHARRDGA
jgi:hypothetical protein